MIKILIQIAIGAVGLIVLLLVFAWVVQIGPFKRGPSAAAKLQPKVEKAVEKTQTQAAGAATELNTQATAGINASEKKGETHVAKVRAQRPAPAPGADRIVYRDYPDRQFRVGVCDTIIYEGDPACDSYRGQPEGRGSAKAPRTLSRRPAPAR